MARNHPHLYEISTVPWLVELSRALGRKVTLGTVPSREWDRIQELGFDYVWLMGVWRKSPAGRRIFQNSEELYPVYSGALPDWTEDDVIGSPYSIQAYEPDPETGDWSELDKARKELERRGVGLILDFVPNHTGPDHPWVKSHPERYIQGSAEVFEASPGAFFQVETAVGDVNVAKGRDPYFDPWKDTAQLNYYNPGTRQAMIDTLKEINQHADGVRCDMAMLVLNDIFHRTWGSLLREPTPEREFWEEVRQEIPDMVLIAEAYWDTEYRLQQLGFDFVYDKRLYDRLRHSSSEEIRQHMMAEWEYQRRLVRFIENHDEPRSAGVFSPGRLRAAAVAFATLPGLKLYNQGQLEGYQIHLPVQLSRARVEEPDADLLDYYQKLLSATDHACFHEGHWRLLQTQPIFDNTSGNLICHLWQLDDEMRLTAINFGENHSQCRVSLEGSVLPDRTYRLHDLLGSGTFERHGAQMCGEGLHVVLAGHQSHIFSIE